MDVEMMLDGGVEEDDEGESGWVRLSEKSE